MALAFTHCDEITVGAEIELQLLDAETLDLAAAAPEIFRRLGTGHSHIKPELFQSIIEINTGICRNAAEIRRDVRRALAELTPACSDQGVLLACAGSHPFAHWAQRLLYPSERYEAMLDRHRWALRRLTIFGTHVHLGMRDGEHAIAMINAWLPYLPHVLALSASSPFWEGHDTGLASCRTTVFESLPTAGHPCVFRDWREFEHYYDAARRSGAIHTIRDIWWDIRPHPDFGTIEIRICDAIPTVGETVALVAFIHCLTHWLDDRLRDGWMPEPIDYWIVRENKWRASRWGFEAELVQDASGRTELLREDLPKILEQLAPYARRFGCEAELESVGGPMRDFPSYERQRRWYSESRNPKAIVENLVRELAEDEPVIPEVPAYI
jgi:carboxylate-amine ligase